MNTADAVVVATAFDHHFYLSLGLTFVVAIAGLIFMLYMASNTHKQEKKDEHSCYEKSKKFNRS